jgi:hypothetical protein
MTAAHDLQATIRRVDIHQGKPKMNRRVQLHVNEGVISMQGQGAVCTVALLCHENRETKLMVWEQGRELGLYHRSDSV